jgi:pimeloyl-ACP methyl ester carboxylesterase
MQATLKHWVFLTLATLLWTHVALAEMGWPRQALSADGVPVTYEVHGAGEPTLVFIHGWSCDSRYWRAQVDHFAASHRVIAIDLAGHGHSGLQRDQYSMAAFGQDVRAVVEAEAAERVILIGHSMGGDVSLAATAAMPDRVAGVIGVDTFHDVAKRVSPQEIEAVVGPLRADFGGNVLPFVAGMFRDATDAALREWVISDMSAAPPKVALSAVQQLFEAAGDQATLAILRANKIPVVTINADLWPTNTDGNVTALPGFQAIIMPGTDHFLHMAQPKEFNGALARVIGAL